MFLTGLRKVGGGGSTPPKFPQGLPPARALSQSCAPWNRFAHATLLQTCTICHDKDYQKGVYCQRMLLFETLLYAQCCCGDSSMFGCIGSAAIAQKANNALCMLWENRSLFYMMIHFHPHAQATSSGLAVMHPCRHARKQQSHVTVLLDVT